MRRRHIPEHFYIEDVLRNTDTAYLVSVFISVVINNLNTLKSNKIPRS